MGATWCSHSERQLVPADTNELKTSIFVTCRLAATELISVVIDGETSKSVLELTGID